MECPVCRSKELEVKFQITNERKVFGCFKCGTEFLFPQLNDVELKVLYSENYYHAWGIRGAEENETTRQMKMATFGLRLALILRFFNEGKILDVGCATGYFLEAARIHGFEPFGVEFSEYSAAISKKKFGDNNVFWGTLEESTFQDKSFEVISMSDLIEHVRDPRQTLLKAAALLKDGGIIMIVTPDTKTISRILMGKRWLHFKPEHFFYFSLSSISFIAKQCGLSAVHYEKAKKALTLDYLHTQFNVYKHWFFTPAFNILHAIIPEKLSTKNFFFSIGEMVVIFKKNVTIHPSQ